MSQKNRDAYQRWRSRTIGFRMSPEEGRQLDIAVKLSGLTKQDYICNRCLDRTFTVQPNPRVYKALKDQLAAVLDELHTLTTADEITPELLDTIRMITAVLSGTKGDDI